MKYILIGICVLATGCATGPRLTCDEACGVQGMICQSQSVVDGYGGQTNGFMCKKDETGASAEAIARFGEAGKSKEAAAKRDRRNAWILGLIGTAVIVTPIIIKQQERYNINQH